LLIALQILVMASARAQTATDNPNQLAIARLKYYGGDWYWGNSALPNLISYLKENTSIPVASDEVRVTLEDDRLFNFPFIYLTGHGTIKLSEDEALRLNKYLTSGGFLFANDSYGLKDSFLEAMKLVFPDAKSVELPFDHGLFSCYYTFANGLPKIHKHDGKPPQAFGWFSDGRLVTLFVYESDIGDGWEDPQVHNDPPEVREQALKMGVNIIVWALTN
jgi:hypothetical protein